MAKPFPFLARAHRLARDFLEPLQERLGEDAIGLAIGAFMAEIEEYQARRLARFEMADRPPHEPPWLYRDLYQVDPCDRENRIVVAMPVDALALYRPDGRAWFMAWQDELWRRMMPQPLGPRPRDVPPLELIRAEVAAKRVQDMAA